MTDDTDDKALAIRRERMVQTQITARDVSDPDVVAAMRTVPRHLFVPEHLRSNSYTDGPLPIGHGQTISQPYVVASMTEHLSLDHTSRVLEVGTGSGYQTAVLAEIARQVNTVEIIPQLLDRAREVLTRLRYSNVEFLLGDGSRGWPEVAPFDAIIVTAAAGSIPDALVDQLRTGGRMVIPVETGHMGTQELVLVEKLAEAVRKSTLYGVRFVPLQTEEPE